MATDEPERTSMDKADKTLERRMVVRLFVALLLVAVFMTVTGILLR